MDLDELMAERRKMAQQDSLIVPRNENCLTIRELEILADDPASSTEGLCDRCRTLLDRMKVAKAKVSH